jgi:hypothetical protein
MAGVSLVGYSGSLIKDALHEAAALIVRTLSNADAPANEPIESPEATKVLIGIFFILFAQILCVPSIPSFRAVR